ncbi:hypothetical protein LIER_38153 [Lithospermum erythrorhizon]|uniref:Uncharacterized protein n=1 Tax=Lithospermum erythrorhizon TaxID=34254 RepID=A0AAV3PXL2_LITER
MKKNKRYLKGIMKFLSYFGKGEGSSSEAQAYLAHSDSNQDIEPSQTTTHHRSLLHITQHTCGQTSHHTPVWPENFGFGEGDDVDIGGMGFFSGPPGGV